MGRAPCCDKQGLKKGPWTPDEDQKLVAYIQRHGHGSWRALPKHAGLLRCGKSCRLRWTNYLRPDIKRGRFTVEEEQLIIHLHAILGNRWSAIAAHLAGRTDNEIKNYWNTHLKKRLLHMGIDPVTHKATQSPPLVCSRLSHLAQWDSARMEAEARLVRGSNSADAFIRSWKAQASSSDSTRTDMPSIQMPTFTCALVQSRIGPFAKQETESILRCKPLSASSPTANLSNIESAGAALLLNHFNTMGQTRSRIEQSSLSPTSTLRTFDAQDSPYGTPDPNETLLQCEKIMHGEDLSNTLNSTFKCSEGIARTESLSSALLVGFSKPCERIMDNDNMSNTLSSALDNYGLLPDDASIFQGSVFAYEQGNGQPGTMWERPLVQLDSPSLSEDDMTLGDEECSSSYSSLLPMPPSMIFDLSVESQRSQPSASAWVPVGIDASAMSLQRPLEPSNSPANATGPWQDANSFSCSDYWSNMLKLIGTPGQELLQNVLPLTTPTTQC